MTFDVPQPRRPGGMRAGDADRTLVSDLLSAAYAEGRLTREEHDTRVAQAMDAAGTREVRLSRILQVDVDFASAGALEDQLRGLVLPSGARVVVDGVDWSDRAHIRVAIPTDSVAEFDVALATLSAGAVVAEPVAERWTDYVSGMV